MQSLPERFLKKIKEEYPIKNWLKSSFKIMAEAKKLFPEYILFPIELFEQFVLFRCKNGLLDYRTFEGRHELSTRSASLATAVNWMFSKGIYKFDQDIFNNLITTKIKGNIPTEVLLRLPEYCVFFDTKGFDYGDGRIVDGFFAHLDYSTIENESYLRILIVSDNLLSLPIVLKLGDITIKESMQYIVSRAIDEIDDMNDKTANYLINYSKRDEYSNWIEPFINMLLYICQQEPDIDLHRKPGHSPKRHSYKKTKKGLRLFEPSTIKIWDTGVINGNRLRDSYKKINGNDRKIRPHLRRAHWHGYWLGPKDGDRNFIYKWLNPIYVDAEG